MSVVPSTTSFDHAAFDRLIATELPEVAADLDAEDRALLHMEMAAVARATSRAVASGDAHTIGRHFALMDNVLARADSNVENAVYVSYLENVFLGDERPAFVAARNQLPPRLAKALAELEAHWEKLAKHARDT